MKAEVQKLSWYLFYRDQLLLQETPEGVAIPCGAEPPLAVDRCFTVDYQGAGRARAAHLAAPVEANGYRMVGLRASWDLLPQAAYDEASKAFQLLYWDTHSRYCPVCGTPTEQTTPICKRCPQCGNELYPPIAPAIIVLIRKGEEVLLVHARNFRGNFHGLVAGFIEVGETLEECVRREVREETGLEIKELRYFASQPWPYPSGLMIGFTAQYAGGSLKLQAEELSTGAFFSKDNLPEIPRKLSLARKLIDAWLEGKI
ncbi:MAG: NAD(+) diphosphatase [Parabacteroides sp.]|nr:NAD(+) diphosphatase [Parabacteroides sp.]